MNPIAVAAVMAVLGTLNAFCCWACLRQRKYIRAGFSMAATVLCFGVAMLWTVGPRWPG